MVSTFFVFTLLYILSLNFATLDHWMSKSGLTVFAE